MLVKELEENDSLKALDLAVTKPFVCIFNADNWAKICILKTIKTFSFINLKKATENHDRS